jgi:hypothetical protein
MVKVGDTVKWENTRTKEKLSGKVTGGEKGKRWRIEKGGKRYYVEKDRVKKGVVKKSEKKKVAPKKTAPKKKSVDKDSFLDVLSVMGEVAKSKGKSTKKQIDSKVALDKKLKKGKLTNKDFKELMFEDDDTSENIYDFEENLSEGQGYSMGYWISRVSKRADDFDDLTDSQQQRLFEIMQRDIHIQTRKKMKSFYDESVKGKKFKSLKELKDLFIDKYAEATY